MRHFLKTFCLVLLAFNLLIIVFSQAHAENVPFKIGETVYAKMYEKWYLATIVALNGEKVKVHYEGYSDYWDSDLDKKEIQKIVSNKVDSGLTHEPDEF